MKLDYKMIGDRIRRLRKEKKWTQQQLAERANRASSFVGLIERGERIMSLETLCEFANALDCSTDELLGMKPRQIHHLAYAKELLELAQALACEESHS